MNSKDSGEMGDEDRDIGQSECAKGDFLKVLNVQRPSQGRLISTSTDGYTGF